MMHTILLFLCIITVKCVDEAGHYFTSTHKLTMLMDKERSSLNLVREYIANQRQTIAKLKQAQLRIKEGYGAEDESYYSGIDHPLNAYRLIHRFVAHWKNVYAMVFNVTNEEMFHDKLFDINNEGYDNNDNNMDQQSGSMPHPNDYHGSYKSLLRLQMTYQLSVRSLADGLIRGRMSDPLDEADCYNMALTAIQKDLCEESVEWLAMAAEKASDEEESEVVMKDVEDFKERLKIHGKEKMKDVILDYLMDAVGYNENEEGEEDIQEEEDEGEVNKPYEDNSNIINNSPLFDDIHINGQNQQEIKQVSQNNFVKTQPQDDVDSDEIEYDEEDVENLLKNAAKFEASEINFESIKMSDDNIKSQKYAEIIGDHEDSLEFNEAMKQASDELEQLDKAGSTCGGDGGGDQNFVVEEREIGIDQVGFGAGLGKTLKIRYEGAEIPQNELDEIEKLAEKLLGDNAFEEQKADQTYNFYALCRGEETKKREALTCRYRHATDHYNVWKEELISKDPYIAMIYDFIKDKEIEELKELSIRSLSRALAGNSFTDERVQSSSWHDDTNSSTVLTLSHRASSLTGLDAVNWAEEWQVGQYGIGGHYSVHYDYNVNGYKGHVIRNKKMGDRLATFMLYLNSVDEGGYTVFPRLGVFVRPVKGAAVFWYNYKRNGDPVEDSLHAACPVLLGHKWVANKWIREFGHEFIRPCGKTKAVTL